MRPPLSPPAASTRALRRPRPSDPARRTIEPLPAARTRTESLRLKLEQDIITRRIGPGQKLDEEEIAARFGLSRTPVREALKALTSRGLIEIRPHQGAFVAKPTPRAIAEMIEFMAVLEVTCADLAARRHSSDDRKRIIHAQAACWQAASKNDGTQFYDANVIFHEAIARASRNEYLAEQIRALRQNFKFYCQQILFHAGTMDKSVREHDRLMEAILATNAHAASTAMRDHIGDLQQSLMLMIGDDQDRCSNS